MAGTVTASIVKNDSTSPTVFQNVNGTEIGQLCRAWVSFTGSTGVILKSFNVLTVTRNAVGDYSITFTNNLADGDYVVAPSYLNPGTNPNYVLHALSQTSSVARVVMNGAAGSAADPTTAYIAVFR